MTYLAEVFNNQRKYKVELASISDFVGVLQTDISEAGDNTFTVVLISDRKMRQLNRQFRNKDSTTDVLSFPHEPDEFDAATNNLGDIVISVEQGARQARENGLTLENEIKQLILHGLLHLCGYDHETDNGEMNARELELRDKLGI
jgi:probable rRNA maturation factor